MMSEGPIRKILRGEGPILSALRRRGFSFQRLGERLHGELAEVYDEIKVAEDALDRAESFILDGKLDDAFFQLTVADSQVHALIERLRKTGRHIPPAAR
jgi:hypothetical protein